MALNSWPFVVLVVAAAVTLPSLPVGARSVVFVGLNLWFVTTYWSAGELALAIGCCLVGYGLVRFAQSGQSYRLALGVLVLVSGFAYLRGYGLDGLSTTSPPRVAGALAFAGLSFLFFRLVHLVVDSAGGTAGHVTFGRLLAYCTNFTTALMGPIQRFQDFSAQWDSPGYGQASFEERLDALNRCLRGLAKAFALAPWLQPYVLQPGLPIETMGATEILARTYAFYVYLYLDFSGYCDVVIGAARLMGLTLPENFQFPFLARNVSAYWLRVHRSLTEWLTDYVFTPSFRTALRSPFFARHAFVSLSACLLLTMLVAGVWHGTTLNFIAFGLVHGFALVVVRGYDTAMARWLGPKGFRALTGRWWVTGCAVVVTYNFTSLAYTFFVLNVDESLRLFGRLAELAAEGLVG